MRHLRSAGRTLLVAIMVLAIPKSALGQRGQTSAMTGVVKDASQAALVGATVTATSAQLIGGFATAATNEAGVYRFLELLPGEYTVRVQSAGFKTLSRSGLELAPGATVTLDWALELSPTGETVEVRGAAPMVDVHTAATPQRLPSAILRDLPLTRTTIALAGLTPGVVGDSPFGASANSFTATVDGTPASSPTTGWPNVHPLFEAIDEMQVVAAGAGAEYGDFTGVQTNIIVRSGANVIRGTGELRTRRPRWVGDNRDDLPERLRANFRPTQIISDWDASASLGGAIARDRIWYFGTYQQMREDTRPSGWAHLPRSSVEPVSSRRDARGLFKLTAAPARTVRVEAFYNHNRQRGSAIGAGPYTSTEAFLSIRDDQHAWNARLLWTPSDRWFLSVVHGGHHQDYCECPTPPQTPDGPSPRYDYDTFMESGNFVWFYDNVVRPINTALSVTRVIDGRAGLSHELKLGVDHQIAKSTTWTGYPGGMWVFEASGVPVEAVIQAPTLTRPIQQRVALFAQDRWRLGSRVTLEPGVRMAFNRGGMESQRAIFATNPISPRIGVAWDVAADHRTVVRAHYGRYHDALFTSHYEFMDPLGAASTSFVQYVTPTQYNVVSVSGLITDRSIDQNLTHSYADAFVLGIEREMFSDFSLRTQYVDRHFDNFLAFVDPKSVYSPVTRQDPGADGRLGTADDAGPITVFERQNADNDHRLLTNVDEAHRRYRAVQIIGTKRYSRSWHLQAAYTWSQVHGNVPTQSNTNAASGGLGPYGQFSNPNRFINVDGTQMHDHTHQATVLGTMRLPYWGGVTVGAFYRYYTGRAFGRTINVTGLRQGAESVRVERRGAYRVAGTNQVDLRLEKTWSIGGARVGLLGDVLNLTNQGTSRAMREASGPNFGTPIEWTTPRSLRAGGRVSF